MTETDRRKPHTVLFMSTLITAEVVCAFESVMMYSALPTMNRFYGDPVGVGWLVTAFLLVASASAAVGGRLGDLYGRSQVTIAMLMFAAAGSLISAWAPSLAWVIAGRAVQGLSGAIFPLVIGLARENLPHDKVPVAIGYLGATAAIGAAVGLIMGGVIVDHFPWHWMFYLSSGLACISIVLCIIFVPPSPRQQQTEKLDVVGGVLFVPAIALVLFALTSGRDWGWLDWRTLGMTLAGLALLAVWARYEWSHANPLIDVRQLASRNLALTNLAAALFGLGASQVMLVMLLLLQQPAWTGIGLGLSATMAGMVKLPGNFIALVGGPLSGYITARHGGRAALITGSAVIAASWIILAISHDNLWFIGTMMVFAGLGGSMTFAAIPNLVVEAVPQDRTSEATGITVVVRQASAAVGSQIAIFLLASSTIVDPAMGPGVHASPAAYQLTILAMAGVSILCLLTGVALPKKVPAATLKVKPA
jgi:MFS family permease